MQYIPVFDSECWKCGASPTVGLCLPRGPEDTELCGPHFFAFNPTQDWSEWNDIETEESNNATR